MYHGGNIRAAEQRFGFAPGEMLDLSTGICPRSYPVPQDLLNAANWGDLPQAEDEQHLEHVLRQAAGIPDEAAILAAPGSQILINMMPLLGKPGDVTIPQPAYAEHETAWAQHGYAIQHHPAPTLPSPLHSNAVVVQPGNPMGEWHDPEPLLARSQEAAQSGHLVVVDEAFADLYPHASMLPHCGGEGLIVLRSFGKFYGLAGLRLGIAVGHPADIARLAALLGPWACSTPALQIGAMALADTDFQVDQRRWIAERHQDMVACLERHGIRIAGGTGLYVLAEIDDAAALHGFLALEKIWTRVFDYAPNWLRFGVADTVGLNRLDAALTRWRQKII